MKSACLPKSHNRRHPLLGGAKIKMAGAHGMPRESLELYCYWKNLVVPSSLPKHSVLNQKIKDVSFSNISSDVLYVLTEHSEIFSLCVTTLSVSKMMVSGLQSPNPILRILCWDEFIYVLHYGTVSKCVIDDDNLKVTVMSSHQVNMLQSSCEPAIAIKRGCVFIMYFGTVGFNSGWCIALIDSDTMTLLSTTPLAHVPSLFARDIAVSVDNKLHIVSADGVYVYTMDVIHTGQVYLQHEGADFSGDNSWAIRCTNNGYSIVTMEHRLAVVSCSDYTILYYIVINNTTPNFFVKSWVMVRYSPVDDSLAVVSFNNERRLSVVPREAYLPPFSLQQLCLSTISSSPNILLATYLPPILLRLFKDANLQMHMTY